MSRNIKPLLKEEQPEDKIKLLEEQGVLQKAAKGKIPLRKPIAIAGKPISETVIEGREAKFEILP